MTRALVFLAKIFIGHTRWRCVIGNFYSDTVRAGLGRVQHLAPFGSVGAAGGCPQGTLRLCPACHLSLRCCPVVTWLCQNEDTWRSQELCEHSEGTGLEFGGVRQLAQSLKTRWLQQLCWRHDL